MLNKAEYNLGLKVNYEKTVLYRIGSLANSKAQLYTQKVFVWDDPPIETLGIVVDVNQSAMATLNMQPLYQKTVNTLAAWKGHKLTLMGKVLVVNTLVESLFVYKFSVLSEIEMGIIQNIQDETMKFLWDSKSAKISLDIL